jgi:hypothetical protein
MPTPTGQVRNSSRERSSNGNSKEDSVEATDSGQNNNQEEQETQEYNSSSEEESEYDEEEDEKKRMEYLEDMNCLEKYFSDLKEMLYHERMRDLELKQQSVFNGELNSTSGPRWSRFFSIYGWTAGYRRVFPRYRNSPRVS